MGQNEAMGGKTVGSNKRGLIMSDKELLEKFHDGRYPQANEVDPRHNTKVNVYVDGDFDEDRTVELEKLTYIAPKHIHALGMGPCKVVVDGVEQDAVTLVNRAGNTVHYHPKDENGHYIIDGDFFVTDTVPAHRVDFYAELLGE